MLFEGSGRVSVVCDINGSVCNRDNWSHSHVETVSRAWETLGNDAPPVINPAIILQGVRWGRVPRWTFGYEVIPGDSLILILRKARAPSFVVTGKTVKQWRDHKWWATAQACAKDLHNLPQRVMWELTDHGAMHKKLVMLSIWISWLIIMITVECVTGVFYAVALSVVQAFLCLVALSKL